MINFRQSPKNLIFDHISAMFAKMGVFGKNRASSVFSVYGPLTSCKESEKTNEPILRKTPN